MGLFDKAKESVSGSTKAGEALYLKTGNNVLTFFQKRMII